MPSTSEKTNKEKILQEIRSLEEEIRKHNYYYYFENSPKITDKEFDKLFQKLKKLEEKYPELASPDSPTKQVGSDLSLQSDFAKFKHKIPVLSLENTYNINELNEWLTKTGLEELYSIEWKIDGASIVLYYEKGNLKNAVTRGTGGIGDDVTDNIKTIQDLPHKLPQPLDIILRGEVYMNYDDFEEFNETYGGKYANPRNLAAGSIKHKYASEVAKRPLRIFTYDLYFTNGRGKYQTNQACLNLMKELGFPLTPDTEIVKGKEVSKVIEKFKKRKDKMPFPTDGLVIKLNDLTKRDILGETSHSPRWARAFKFDALTKESIIEEIYIQVGRTGKITPRAKIQPIQLAGTTVQYATLHNFDYIRELGIGIGARVKVSKRGEIIPAVEEVIQPGLSGIFPEPTHCPACNTKLERIQDSVDLFCTNRHCPEREKQTLIFFCHKKQMNIEGLGEKQIQLFYEKGWIRSPADLYELCKYKDEMLQLDGFGEKSVKIILDGIEKSKSREFQYLLPSLGLNELGPKVTELLIEEGYDSMDKLLELVEKSNAREILESIHGIGPQTAIAIIQQLKDPEIRNLIERLRKAGLNFEAKVHQKSENLVFEGQTWCVTGSFQNFQPREKALEIIVHHGGRKVSSVSSKTTHLLYGEGAGSKLEKAKELGIQLVNEEEFLKILHDHGINWQKLSF